MTQTAVQARQITLTQALNEAMREEMHRDERVFIMGEDIQTGVYGASAGLANDFGMERVRDCPLSENAFFGAAVGAAAVGMRPIVESAFCFSWVAMDSLVSQAAKMRYMFGGQVNLPIVYRLSTYYGGNMAAHHSDRAHPIFMNIPGFKVIFPSTAYDGKGLMKTAIRDDDVTIFCEDRTVLGARGFVPEEEYTVPLGVADVKREGTDVTIVAIGGMVPRALEAAGEAGAGGHLGGGGGPTHTCPPGQGDHTGIGYQDGEARDGGHGPQDVQRRQRDCRHGGDGGVLVLAGAHPEVGNGQRPYPLQPCPGAALLPHRRYHRRRRQEDPGVAAEGIYKAACEDRVQGREVSRPCD